MTKKSKNRKTNHLKQVIPTKPVSQARTRVIIGVILGLLFLLAVFLRSYLPYPQVFTNVGIKYSGNDAYYQMRIVEVIVHNFPHIPTADPYILYGSVSGVGNIHFFDWFIAFIIWIVGLGSPSQHLIDVIGVYYPVILGALTVIPVYFIGKEVFNKWAGLLAAAFVSFAPGEFLGRSILGFTDTHIAESLIATVLILFLIKALKAIPSSLKPYKSWKMALVYSALTGLALGIFIITWAGALLFVFILFLYFVIQFILNHLKGKSKVGLVIIAIPIFFIGLIFSAVSSAGILYNISLPIAIVGILLMYGISVLLRNYKKAYYPLSFVGVSILAVLVAYLISPAIVRAMLQQFGLFNPKGGYLTISEVQPFLAPQGTFTLALAWGNFTMGFFVGVIALFVLIYHAFKYNNSEKLALVIWSLIILAATLGQRRFAYYLAVNISILVGYASWWFISKLNVDKTVKHQNKIVVAFGLIIVFITIYVWNIPQAISTAKNVVYAPSNAWVESLVWMKANTPEPFNDPNAYYRLETESYDKFKYPESAYGVLSWWDYGYWITGIAHRIPNSNPSQDPETLSNVASFIVSQNETEANGFADKGKSSYIILDSDTAYISPTQGNGKFWAIPVWLGKSPNDYFEVYYINQQGSLKPVMIYYPAYYQAMSSRLYNFDGKSADAKPLVISWQDYQGHKVINQAQAIGTYAEAVDFVNKNPEYRIVGTQPTVSPVPLEALKDYKEVYQSNELIDQNTPIPQIKVFQRLN